MGVFDGLKNVLGGVKDSLDPMMMLKGLVTPERIDEMMKALDKYLSSFKLNDGEKFPELSINKMHGQWFFIVKTFTMDQGKIAHVRVLAKMPAVEFVNSIMFSKKESAENPFNKPAEKHDDNSFNNDLSNMKAL